MFVNYGLLGPIILLSTPLMIIEIYMKWCLHQYMYVHIVATDKTRGLVETSDMFKE